MEVNEVIERRRELEDTIKELFSEFEKDSGVFVKSIHLRRVDVLDERSEILRAIIELKI